MGGKRDTPIDYKLAHLHSQLSYAPICGSAWNRTKYYNTDLGFVKENFPRQAVFLRKRIPASSADNSAAGEKLPPAAEWIH